MRFLGFARSLLRNRRRQDDLPRFLTYTVTFGCNARCVMCDSWKKPFHDDLELSEIESIFEQLPRMDAVRLTGGEPFVRKDMTEIAWLAKHKLKPLYIHVTSNGFLTDRIVEFCEDRPRDIPLQLLISIDGVEKKHDEIRGHGKAFAYAMRTLERLAPRRKELRLELAVNQTIVDAEGAAQYPELRDRLQKWGVAHQIVMAYDESATYAVDGEQDLAPKEIGQFTTFGEFSKDQIRALLDEAWEDTRSLPFWNRVAKRYYLRGIRERLLDEGTLTNPPCVALNAHLRLFPNGDVPTCQFNGTRVGNLRETSFAELWQSARTREQRNWVRACPGCWAECEVLPSAIYTGHLLGSLLPKRKRKGPQQDRPKPLAVESTA
jgi:MoaA/NifB/PqqE/SkfB family radical SAM enzyme